MTVDKLSELGARMIDALEADQDYREEIRSVVLLHDGGKIGVCASGFADDAALVPVLLECLRMAIENSNGKLVVIKQGHN